MELPTMMPEWLALTTLAVLVIGPIAAMLIAMVVAAIRGDTDAQRLLAWLVLIVWFVLVFVAASSLDGGK